MLQAEYILYPTNIAYVKYLNLYLLHLQTHTSSLRTFRRLIFLISWSRPFLILRISLPMYVLLLESFRSSVWKNKL